MSKNKADLIAQGFERLNEDEVEFIDQFNELGVGDPIEGVDELIYGSENTREFSNLDVDYENVCSDSLGYLAEVTVNGEVVAVVDAMNGRAMLRDFNEYVLDEAIMSLAGVDESETEQMMDKEGMSELEVDKGLNTLSIVDESAGDVKVTISFDLIESVRSDAEKSDSDVFTVTRE